MVYYLKHPQYGEKVAVSEMERDFDVQNGWEEFDPKVEPTPAQGNNLKRRRKPED